jgi:hypothetical protein
MLGYYIGQPLVSIMVPNTILVWWQKFKYSHWCHYTPYWIPIFFVEYHTSLISWLITNLIFLHQAFMLFSPP